MNETKTAPDGAKVKLLTIKEIAQNLGANYIEASGLVKILVTQGALKQVGSRSIDGQRGKPSAVFEVPEVIELVFWQDGEISMANPVDSVNTDILPDVLLESAPEPEKAAESVQVIS